MESPIFIVGCERSGNTLLRLILNQSPVLYIPSESGFLDQLRKQQELYGDFTELHQRWFFIRDLQTNKATSKTHSFPIFKLTLEEAEVAIAETAPTNYSGAAFALFQAATRKQGKQYWGDKTPRYIFDIPWLAEAFPQAKFIHIIRDGRDVASSLIKAGWVNNFVKAAYYWQKKVEAGISARKILEKRRYYELNYEQLVMYPEETVKDLCNWLRLEYVPSMLQQNKNATNYISGDWHLHEMLAKPIDPSRAYAWKQQLFSRQVADFESVAGELLKELGYEVTGVKVPFYLRTTRSLMEKLKSNLRSNAPKILRQLGIN